MKSFLQFSGNPFLVSNHTWVMDPPEWAHFAAGRILHLVKGGGGVVIRASQMQTMRS